MISNHIKKGFWLWIALCVGLWVSSKQPQFQDHAEQMARIATLGLWGGTALLLTALLIVSYIERSRAGKRLTDLYWRVHSGETVEIRGASGLIRLIVMLTITGIVATALSAAKSLEFHALRLILLIAAVVILASLEMLTVIPLLRQPILRVSREGLESPVFGKLSWRDVDGLSLSELQLRGFTFHRRLHLSILRLPFLTQQMHPASRLQQRIRSIFRPNDKLHLRLVRTSEMPKVILRLCQYACAEYTNNPGPARPMTEERRKMLGQLWEMRIDPPRVQLQTHWVTWVATAIVAAGMLWLGYLLFSAPA
jgi:hypothetical protein